jgi:hypothetical protein
MVGSDREFRDVLAERIERGIASGEFAGSVDPRGLATVIIGMLRGVALQSMLDDGVDLDGCRVEVETVLIGRLASEGLRPAVVGENLLVAAGRVLGCVSGGLG